MSWVRVWVHLVFSTYNKNAYLIDKTIRQQFFEHIRSNAKDKNIWVDKLNGHKEHIHCLISLRKDQAISRTAQLIKGESSWWINHNKLIPYKFKWQDDYCGVGVSESHVESVRNYIDNQEEHHRKNLLMRKLILL